MATGSVMQLSIATSALVSICLWAWRNVSESKTIYIALRQSSFFGWLYLDETSKPAAQRNSFLIKVHCSKNPFSPNDNHCHHLDPAHLQGFSSEQKVPYFVFLLYCHHVYPSVHGFVNTSLTVDEGSRQQTIEIRRDIKGNASAEPSSVDRIDFTVICNDSKTGTSKMQFAWEN